MALLIVAHSIVDVNCHFQIVAARLTGGQNDVTCYCTLFRKVYISAVYLVATELFRVSRPLGSTAAVFVEGEHNLGLLLQFLEGECYFILLLQLLFVCLFVCYNRVLSSDEIQSLIKFSICWVGPNCKRSSRRKPSSICCLDAVSVLLNSKQLTPVLLLLSIYI